MRGRLTQPDEGWAWVVMVASFGSHMVTGCFLYAVGVIHNAILDRFDENVGKTAWASGLYLGMVSFSGVLAGALVNRYSCRVTMFIGAILMTTGFATCALLPTLDWVIFFFGGLGGLGGGLTYMASVVVLGFNFHDKRNTANGIAVSGCGVGPFVLAPAVEAARETYGNSGLFFILAGLALHQALFGCLFFPSELEAEQKALRTQNYIMKKSNNRFAVLKNMFHAFKILKHFSLLCFCVSMLFACLGIYLVYVHFPRYAIEKGSTPMQASFLISVSGICSCVSRILTGMAANSENVDETVMYFGTFGMLGIATLLLPTYSFTYAGQLVYAVCLGLYSGCCYAIINTLIIHIVGLDELAAGYGICCFLCGCGCIIGPPMAGAIIDVGGSYENAFLLAGFCITVAAVLGMALPCFTKSGQSLAHKDGDLDVHNKDTLLLDYGDGNLSKKHMSIEGSNTTTNHHNSDQSDGHLLCAGNV